ncbi:hypothetical protein FRC19_004765 [Serendipita sp. 401]|nr:hypothetical protein FRC19_004765 [Serendipita sp. 401]KAG9054787.1 hypothetical protein FS842_004173 [Serendipita sp. 407]
MSADNMHPASEMAMHQQFLNQLGANDASLFGIDPTLLPNHLAGYHGDENNDEGDNEGDEEQDNGVELDGENGDRDVDRDVPTPPFFSGDHRIHPGETGHKRHRGTMSGSSHKSPINTHPMQGPNAMGSLSANGAAGNQRISRLPDPRAQALMQLVPMPSQLPGTGPTDGNGDSVSPGQIPGYPMSPDSQGGAGMLPHPAMLMAPGLAPVGLSNTNPADQVATWTESVNQQSYWHPLGMPAFQAPVLVSGGLAATIRDARLAWMVGESVCGHPSCLGRRFERKTNLLKHLLTHVEARPYVCQVEGCDQAFKQKWLLDRHGRVHAANKEVHPCKVPGCTTTCSSLYNLRNHELVHSETKKFLCDFENCGRTFATARNLRLHQRTHTGDKPFACDYPNCGMRYHRPAHLKRHQEIHNDSSNKPQKIRKPRKEGVLPPTPRRRKVTSELDNEIDELAGDGDTYVARLAEGEGEGGSGVRSRPKRAAAVAAVAANRSARWDEGLDLGEDVEEDDEDDDEDEDDAGPDGDGVMDDDYDEEEEDMMDKPPYGRGRGLPRGRGGALVGGPGAGRGRAIASSGGPVFGAVAPFRSQQPPFGMVPEDYHGRAPEAEAMEE